MRGEEETDVDEAAAEPEVFEAPVKEATAEAAEVVTALVLML